jgi:hypothetical protein
MFFSDSSRLQIHFEHELAEQLLPGVRDEDGRRRVHQLADVVPDSFRRRTQNQKRKNSSQGIRFLFDASHDSSSKNGI